MTSKQQIQALSLPCYNVCHASHADLFNAEKLTCAQYRILLAACRGAGNNLAGDVAILLVSGTSPRLTGLGKGGCHPPGAC